MQCITILIIGRIFLGGGEYLKSTGGGPENGLSENVSPDNFNVIFNLSLDKNMYQENTLEFPLTRVEDNF